MAKLKRYCGNYIMEIDNGKYREYCGNYLYELDGNTLEDELAYMKLGSYSVETSGIFEIATFMADNGFLEAAPASYEDLVFENVKGD